MPARDGSRGPEIVAFAREHGMELYEWQQAVLDDFSGTLKGGWTSRANVLITPRQNGKSEILVARALWGLFVARRPLTLYSSHQWASSNEVFLRMKGIIESNPDLEEQVRHVRLSAAQLGFELHSGERTLFLTRSRAAARGFSANEIVFDECHFLSEAAHAALKPSAGGKSAGGQAQMFYAASAVDQSRHPDGLVLTRLRKNALEGEEGLALVEYGAGVTDDEGKDMLPAVIPTALAVDTEILQRANPGCPGRISIEFLLDQARTLDPASFWVEHGGQGDWPDLDGAVSGVIDLDKWASLRDPDSRPVGQVQIAFDVSPDRRRGSVAIAGRRFDGELTVEIVDNAPGVGWLVPRVARLMDDHDPWAVSCDAAQELLAEQILREAGTGCALLDRGDLAQACAGFIDMVEEGRVRHLGDPVLLDAIRGATTSSFGGDGWIFSRRTSHVDISPLYAAVAALHGAANAPEGELRIW